MPPPPDFKLEFKTKKSIIKVVEACFVMLFLVWINISLGFYMVEII